MARARRGRAGPRRLGSFFRLCSPFHPDLVAAPPARTAYRHPYRAYVRRVFCVLSVVFVNSPCLDVFFVEIRRKTMGFDVETSRNFLKIVRAGGGVSGLSGGGGVRRV